MMFRLVVLILTVSFVFLAAVATVLATAEVVLRDGTVIAGLEVRREDDNYVLTLEGGNSFVVPVALVELVRLAGRADDDRRPAAGFSEGAKQVGGAPPPEGPSGIHVSEAETLAGTRVRAPRPSEQTAVFGEPARFQKDIVDNRWVPTSAFDENEDVLEDSRSTWQKSIVDNHWAPTSAFDEKEDVLKNSRSTWRKSIVDNSWTPTDAFSR